MSPLWSRYGVRSASVALLLTGVAGGVYLSQDREIQQQSVSAQAEFNASLAEEQYVKSRHAEYTRVHAQEVESERIAADKAAEAAKAAAKRAAAAEESASRKAERVKAEAEAKKAAEEAEAAANKPKNSGTVAFDGPIPASCSEFSGNRATGCAVMLTQGFGIDQFPCLNKLWAKESGWSHTALNSSSGAYGIPQALPGGKMASAGSDWETNPATQIEWGLGYIKGRYGTPCEAWAHSQSVGWY
ncbi:lytic transglycosylase domain-containing protein [Catenuloplanes sp. NPDC051500]|uniref:aggregation-promoting factor C-terminal-like domain-containing protein n=1 Tax=Catenuloplanes sp. NPDC051500 TaxID=3363959 RepID=UPI0037B72C0F